LQKIHNFIKRHKVEIVTIVVLLLVSVFFRLYRLDTAPPGLYGDEAANGLDILQNIFKGNWQVIYPLNGYREALFFYLQSFGVLIFGNTIFALRIAPAIIGIITTIVLYYTVKHFFGKRIGFLAALLYAILPWAIVISRDGFRANLFPLIICLSVWMAGIASKKPRSILWPILAGLFFGLGAYTYTSYRFYFLFVLLFIAWVFFKHPKFRKAITVVSLTTAIMLIPIATTYLKHPDYFATRGDISILNAPSVPKAAAATTAKTAAMFFIRGDGEPRHNTFAQPALSYVVAPFFVGALVWAYKKRDKKILFCTGWLVLMLVPGFIGYHNAPHYLRDIGALPFLVTITACGFNLLLNVKTKQRMLKILIPSAVCIIYLFTAYSSYTNYFQKWAVSTKTKEAYYYNTSEAAEYILENPERKYCILGSNLHTKWTVDYLTYRQSAQIVYYTPENDLSPSCTLNDNVTFLAINKDSRWQDELPKTYTITELRDKDNYLTITVYSP
jgi:4-amino-4-deoxy-L-arabinose transferase-like glycosyltransferase